MKSKFIASIDEVSSASWNKISGTDYPFLRHEFLSALEAPSIETPNDLHDNAACSKNTGWQPHHLLIHEGDSLIAVMPCYIKYHSYGEYIFDWSWADAYQRHGLNYYPKLFCGIPFTPTTGARLAIADNRCDNGNIIRFVVQAVEEECNKQQLSSFHLLFSERTLAEQLHANNITVRSSFQYHWFNHHRNDQPYQAFDDFVGCFKSRKRKTLNKERQNVQANNTHIMRLLGGNIDDAIWDEFYRFYQLTYAKRSGHGGYLPAHFFKEIGRRMPESLMLVVAYHQDKLIAAALNFVSADALFGRYWGCSKDFEFLHFELCYYQGIEFCIEQGLSRFDAGAQGEHKIQRGFEPVKTYSNHWITHPNFRDAINNFIQQEAQQNSILIDKLRTMLPFKLGG